MIRKGDRVAPILEMHVVATVLDVFERKHSTMLVGGTLSAVRMARVQVEKTGEILEWRVRDLMHV